MGLTQASREAAMSKIPPEIISVIQDKRNPSNNNSQINAGPAEQMEGRLPAELIEMIRSDLEMDPNAMLMGLEEAKHHRLTFIEERVRFVRTAEQDWQARSYGF